SSQTTAASSCRAARDAARSSSSSPVLRTVRPSARRSRSASCRSSATKDLAMTDRMGGGDEQARDYRSVTVESSEVQITPGLSAARVRAGLRKRKNWEQLVKFSAVGATGYVVNLAVYWLLLDVVGLHYISAAVGSFLVAVTNNYTWNRHWTFRAERGGVAYQGMRFLIVSTAALLANLLVLQILVSLGLGELVAQAIAIVLVTPVNFVGN